MNYSFFMLPSDEGVFEAEFIADGELLVRTHIMFMEPAAWVETRQFELSEMLTLLDVPTEVSIAIAAPYGDALFTLILVYEDIGTVVRYTIKFRPGEFTQSSSPLPICPRWERTWYIDIWTQNSNDSEFFEELIREHYLYPSPEGEQVNRGNWSLERMTGLEVEMFTQIFTENSEACIEALSAWELEEQGYSY